jgi:site-specific DNA-methyltransferase (cytosine-N4-specific)
MIRLIERGYRSKKRPSGHNITAKFRKDSGGAIPSNLIIKGNNESNSEYIRACADLGVKVHPARFPSALPEFFLKFLTQPGDLIFDPFAGSNMTGHVAEMLGRQWLAVDIEDSYVRASAIRFGLNPQSL